MLVFLGKFPSSLQYIKQSLTANEQHFYGKIKTDLQQRNIKRMKLEKDFV